MVRIVNNRSGRETLKRRQHEVERCLTACGVLGVGRRRMRYSGGGEGAAVQFPRLCQALTQLGPIFSAFGLYMASRVDVLHRDDCLALAALADQGEVTPIAAVQELIQQESGRPCDEVFPEFDDIPFASRVVCQSHHARLNDGQAVTVTIVHPRLQDYLTCDVELLPLLRPSFVGTVRPGVWFAEAIADFRRILQWQIDLRAQAKALQALARDAQALAVLHVPKIYPELCTIHMLTVEHIPGMSLGELCAACDGIRDEAATEPYKRAHLIRDSTGVEPHTLARRLCMVWLHQALLGGQFPVEVYPDDIILLPTQQIALTGGVFTRLPSDTQKNLWQYLIATSTDDPDKACTYLLRDIVAEGQISQENALRYRFREVIPFRDGGWSRHGASSNLTEHLFVHWRLLSEYGFRPQPPVLGFYRGLFQTLALIQRCAPESDALREGLQDVRTMAMLAQFQEMTELQVMLENLDRYTTMLMELPRKFDDVLTLVAEHSGRPVPQGTRVTQPHNQHNAVLVMIALLLALASVVLVSRHLAASALLGVWGERVSVTAFIVLGALLLRAARRA